MGDVVIAAATAQWDLGTEYGERFEPWAARDPTDEVRGPLWLEADSHLLTVAERVVADRLTPDGHVHLGQIVSGDSFMVSATMRDRIWRQFGAEAIEMESAAVAWVCWRHGVPFLAIRGISDHSDGHTHEQYRLNRSNAAKHAAAIVKEVIADASGGP